MGVYNPLVDMPETCDSCFMYGKCELWLDCENSADCRHPDCPLVEVKSPHGDLVDRNDIKYWAERAESIDHLEGIINQFAPIIEAEGKDDD